MVTEDQVKNAGDAVAVGAGLAVWLQWMPVAVGLFTILYTVWRFIEALDVRRQKGQFPWAKFGSVGTERQDAQPRNVGSADQGDGKGTQ